MTSSITIPNENCDIKNDENKIEPLKKKVNFFSHFGQDFKLIKNTVNLLKTVERQQLKTILLIGHPNSKKLDLARVLVGNYSKIYFKAVGQNEFGVFETDNTPDSTKINNNAIFTYNKYTLWPGFGYSYDSSIDEVIGKYSSRKILLHSIKMKIVIVMTYETIQSKHSENDFLTNLKQVSNLFTDLDKYQKSFYLIITEVENYKSKFTTSEQSIINETIGYLIAVKNKLMKENKADIILENVMKIIDIFVDEGHQRMKIFRKPHKEEKMLEDSYMMYHVSEIRRMLLNDANMNEPHKEEFNFTLSDSAENYLHTIFKNMNSYSQDMSKVLTNHLISHFYNQLSCKLIFEDINDFLTNAISETQSFINKTTNENNPHKYVYQLQEFLDKHNFNMTSYRSLNTFLIYNEYLQYLGIQADVVELSEGSYSGLLNLVEVIKFLHDKRQVNEYTMKMFEFITSYVIQRIKNISSLVIQRVEKKFDINKPDSKSYPEIANVSGLVIKDIRSTFAVNDDYNIFCDNNARIIFSFIVVLSHLNDEFFDKCPDTSRTLIIAFHTVFIDIDVTDDSFKGKDLTIIAPKWEVIGKKLISLDGLSDLEKLPKAAMGQVGKRGENGRFGGNFRGLGMIFVNDDLLTISTNGGDGQDGQDGGDGFWGIDGSHGYEPTMFLSRWNDFLNFSESSLIGMAPGPIVVEEYVAEGFPGKAGGDSGEGGDGGFGGYGGKVLVHPLKPITPNFINFCKNGNQGKKGENGIPGVGGLNGKNVRYYLVYSSNSTKSFYLKDIYDYKVVRAKNGRVLKASKQEDFPFSYPDNNLCEDYIKFLKYYDCAKGHSHFSDGVTDKFMRNILKKSSFET